MDKRRKPAIAVTSNAMVPGYDQILGGVVQLLEQARRASARAVNAFMTATYWEIGRRIVEFEQGGKGHAEYGTALLKRLAADLTDRFGRGFSWRNLYQMRGFYLTYSGILQTTSAKLGKAARPASSSLVTVHNLARRFPLPWSHYVLLLKVDKPDGREFLRGRSAAPRLDRATT